MKQSIHYINSTILTIACAGLIGCTAGGMKNVQKSGFLSNYDQLKPGSGDQAALVYVDTNTDFKRYNKIMFERVTVTLASGSKNNQLDPATLNMLTNYYQKALINAVKSGYQVVDKPGPDVLWVRAAITDVVPSNPTSNTLSSIVPIGIAVSAATKATTDANLGTGEAATEIEILDSVSKKRLAAAVDRRQGGKAAFRGKWVDTQQAFDYWAKRFRTRLDDLRK